MADSTGYHRRSQAVAQSDFAPLGCGPGLISDPVDQAKSVAFSVEGNAHYQKLPDRFPPITGIRTAAQPPARREWCAMDRLG